MRVVPNRAAQWNASHKTKIKLTKKLKLLKKKTKQYLYSKSLRNSSLALVFRTGKALVNILRLGKVPQKLTIRK